MRIGFEILARLLKISLNTGNHITRVSGVVQDYRPAVKMNTLATIILFGAATRSSVGELGEKSKPEQSKRPGRAKGRAGPPAGQSAALHRARRDLHCVTRTSSSSSSISCGFPTLITLHYPGSLDKETVI